MADTIQVVAVGHHFGKEKGEVVGYYDHKRRRVGEKFSIQEKDFSSRWMEKLTGKESKEVEEERADRKADTRRKRQHEPVI